MALQQVGGTEAKSGISRLTTELLYWKILSDNDFIEDTATIAFLPSGDSKPGPSDWVPADIVVDPDDEESQAVRVLVGPDGAKDLTPQTTDPVTYRVWVKIDTGSEQFVRRAGTLLVR